MFLKIICVILYVQRFKLEHFDVVLERYNRYQILYYFLGNVTSYIFDVITPHFVDKVSYETPFFRLEKYREIPSQFHALVVFQTLYIICWHGQVIAVYNVIMPTYLHRRTKTNSITITLVGQCV